MSFCTDVKDELAGLKTPARLKLPVLYGFLLFGRAFSAERISMQTGNPAMAAYYVQLLRDVCGVTAEMAQGGGSRVTYRAGIPSESDRLRVLATFDYGMCGAEINPEFLPDSAAAAAFVRGVFLACGNVIDPEQGYNADFSVRSESLAQAFRALLSEHYITAGLSRRGSGYVVYLRSSEMLTNLLTLIGASDRSLELIQTTIVKSFKNKINRARNCDNANISKTVEASIRQRTAIEYLERTGRLESLPHELYAAALLRRDNPEATLHELCRVSLEPITASGLNHRLRKIIDLYNELKPD